MCQFKLPNWMSWEWTLNSLFSGSFKNNIHINQMRKRKYERMENYAGKFGTFFPYLEFSEHKRNKTLLLNYMYAFLVFDRPVRNIFEAGRFQLREVAWHEIHEQPSPAVTYRIEQQSFIRFFGLNNYSTWCIYWVFIKPFISGDFLMKT